MSIEESGKYFILILVLLQMIIIIRNKIEKKITLLKY